MFTADSGNVAWFPQQHADLFFVIKGVIALISTLLLLLHMNRAWGRLSRESTLAQRLRYYALLAFSVLTTGASAEQLHQGVEVNYRNLGALIVTSLLAIAAGTSLYEEQ